MYNRSNFTGLETDRFIAEAENASTGFEFVSKSRRVRKPLRSPSWLHPVDLTPGMLVLVDGAKGEQTGQAGALAVASLTCVIHSRVHTNMYILVGPGAFVQYPRSREKLEVVSDGHGGVKRIDDLIADDDKLKATWLALKDKTPHNVRPKPVGVLNRDRNVGAQKKSVRVHSSQRFRSGYRGRRLPSWQVLAA